MSNRNIADLFEDSAIRHETIEDIKNDQITNNTEIKSNVVVAKTSDKQTENTPIATDSSIENDTILGFLKVEQEKKVVGFHLDKDIRQVFKKILGKNPPRGAQSELANRIFRDFFEKRDLL